MAKTFLERLYDNSPIWFQNLMVSGRGLEYRYRRASDKVLNNQYLFLKTTEKWPPEKFHDFQAQHLREVLRLAFEHVPFYRELKKKLGCSHKDFKHPNDIRLLPTLRKSQVRGQEKYFINDNLNLKQYRKGFTSGTTGTPINIYETQDSFSLRFGFVARLRDWAQISNPLHPRRAQFTGRNIVPNGQGTHCHVYWRYNKADNALLLSTTHISPKTAPYYAQALKDFQPELMDGYPSAMLIIAKVGKRLGLKLPRPKAIIVEAETFLPEHREILEEAFACKVFNQYAASEPSCFWCDCEYGVMHVNPEYGISEILDTEGKPVQPGESGEVVVTSFLNTAMMLIRYRLGDVATNGPEELCLCGKAMPRIAQVEGRLDDILYIPDRGYVGRLDPVFKGLSNIIETQIFQEDLDTITVLMVTDQGYKDSMEENLMSNLRSKLGNTINISIRYVDQVPRGPNGKFRSVISKVAHLYPDHF